MEKHKLEKPDTSKYDINKIFDKYTMNEDFFKYLLETTYPEYLYWDKIKYKIMPQNMKPEEFWALVKFYRTNNFYRTQSLVKSESGESFTWQTLPEAEEFYHEVTLQLGGTLKLFNIVSEKQKQYYMTNGIIEEAIASSQLEGAATTRKVAKKMIREKLKPKNISEQMILNNYKTMVFLEQEFKNSKLTVDNLCVLQAMLTEGTIDDADIGRFRIDSDEIVVAHSSDNIIYHEPPKEEFLKNELKRLIYYANDDLPDTRFVHPLTKAIIIHFWIGYLHPFCDGNGRLARALFYWYLLKHNYWVFSYLPLSRIIKNSPGQYRDAYVYSEQDNYDLTYFIDYNIRKIKQAVKEFEEFVKRQQAINKQMSIISKTHYSLNSRQINLLRYLNKNSDENTTIKTHSNINNITRMTARKDLTRLKEHGFLTTKKAGKYVYYFATEKISELFS